MITTETVPAIMMAYANFSDGLIVKIEYDNTGSIHILLIDIIARE